MLAKLMNIIDFRIEAADGAIGEVHDFYFDEETWMIRYLVADTRRWLPGKRVLLPPDAFGELNWATSRFPIKLTQDQIRNSPDIAEDLPVSRQREIDLHSYYGWTPYWDLYPVGHGPVPLVHPDAVGHAPIPSAGSGPAPDPSSIPSARDRGDPNLRSVREVKGYSIAATDGELGQVKDFVAETDSWRVLYLLVDTGDWLPGRAILLPIDWITDISWPSRHVVVDLQRQRIEEGPPLDPDAPITREYETELYEHFGRAPYWMA